MLFAEIIENHGIDLVNAVAVPFVVSLVVGIPLAIYAGLVGSRLVGFYETRTAAVQELMFLPRALSEAGNIRKANLRLAEMWAATRVAFNGQNQAEASAVLDRLNREAIGFYRHAFLTQMSLAEINAVMGDAQAMSEERWFSMSCGIIEQNTIGLNQLREIESLEPNYSVIFEVPTLGRWLRRSDCGDCCSNCKRVL